MNKETPTTQPTKADGQKYCLVCKDYADATCYENGHLTPTPQQSMDEVLKKHIKITTIGNESNYEWPNHKTFLEALFAAMTEWEQISNKQRDERIKELEYGIKNAIDIKDEYKEMYYNAAQRISELEKENERLKGDNKRDPWDDLGRNLSETTL